MGTHDTDYRYKGKSTFEEWLNLCAKLTHESLLASYNIFEIYQNLFFDKMTELQEKNFEAAPEIYSSLIKTLREIPNQTKQITKELSDFIYMIHQKNLLCNQGFWDDFSCIKDVKDIANFQTKWFDKGAITAIENVSMQYIQIIQKNIVLFTKISQDSLKKIFDPTK